MPFSTGLARFFYAVSPRAALSSLCWAMHAHGRKQPTPLSIDLSPLTHTLSPLLSALSLFLAQGQVFIIKPPASAEGRGIRLANRFQDFPRPGQPAVCQQYIANPYLIEGKKFDCRIYVGVTSFDPLRAYMYEEGLTRFATTDYNSDLTTRSIKNRYMHLTNYSVNKKSEKFVANVDSDRDDEGSKWSLTALWKYLEKEGHDVVKLKVQIRDLLVKTLIAAEHSITSKVNMAGRPSCFELFGFDVLLDNKLKPWLIEVNVACSLASSSPLDKRVKHFMMTDLLHLVGVKPFDRKHGKAADEEAKKSRLLHGNVAPLKHRNVFELQSTPLKELSREDLEIIAEAEDEDRRCGGWSRIFPCGNNTKDYMNFFEFPRYRNTVLAKWYEKPDWTLLGPLLNPNLPPDHELRLLVSEAERSSSVRGERGAAAKRLQAAAEEARRVEKARARQQAIDDLASQEAAQTSLSKLADAAEVEILAAELAASATGGTTGNGSSGATPDVSGLASHNFVSGQPPKLPMAVGCTTGETSHACAQVTIGASTTGVLTSTTDVSGGDSSPFGLRAGSAAPIAGHSGHSSSSWFGLSMGATMPGGTSMAGGLGACPPETRARLGGGCSALSHALAAAGATAPVMPPPLPASMIAKPADVRVVERLDTSTFASRLHQLMRRGDTPPSLPTSKEHLGKDLGVGLGAPAKTSTPLLGNRQMPIVKISPRRTRNSL